MKTLKLLIGILFFLVSGSLQAERISIIEVRCENQEGPLGVQSPQPVFAWKLEADARNISQRAYRILVADTPALLNKDIGNVWDSGRCDSQESII